MPTCPSCQHELKAGVKFCVYCGTAVQVNVPAPQPVPPAAAKPTPAVAQPACPQCGTANTAGTKFCKKCGQPMAGGTAAPPIARPAPSPATKSAPAARPGKRSPLPLIAAGVAVVAIAGAGWFFFRGSEPARNEAVATRQVPFSQAPEAQTPTEPPEPAPVPVETPVETARPVPAPAATAPVRTKTAQAKPVSPLPAPAPAASAPSAPAPTPEPVPVTPPPVTPAPVTQALPAAQPAAATETPRRTEILRPERAVPRPGPTPPAAGYSGPAAGVIVWSGQLEKGAAVSISGTQPSAGTVNGTLPGVPVLIEVDPKDVGVAEAPGPSNGWKSFSLRSRKGRHTVVTIRWRVL